MPTCEKKSPKPAVCLRCLASDEGNGLQQIVPQEAFVGGGNRHFQPVLCWLSRLVNNLTDRVLYNSSRPGLLQARDDHSDDAFVDDGVERHPGWVAEM